MSKRDTYDAGPAPHFQRDDKVEAARFLGSVVRRFLAGREPASAIDSAIQTWEEVSRSNPPDGAAPQSVTRSCNKHVDCAAAEAKAAADGKPEKHGPGSDRAEHCHKKQCEVCFGV